MQERTFEKHDSNFMLGSGNLSTCSSRLIARSFSRMVLICINLLLCEGSISETILCADSNKDCGLWKLVCDCIWFSMTATMFVIRSNFGSRTGFTHLRIPVDASTMSE